MNYAKIEEAIGAIARGAMVLVVDDEDRENEGDLIVAAEKVTSEHIAFMVRHTSGLICLPMTGERLDHLKLPLMVMENTDSHKTAFTVSIDLADGTTTGISAADRARTIRSAVEPSATAEQFHRPGHVFPLRYQPGGVLVRPGHTEAAVDLARLAGLAPAGVLCEVVNDDGSMSRGEALMRFAEKYDIPIVTIEDLVAYRWREEALVTRVADAALPTNSAEFRAFGYRANDTGSEHIALVLGDVAGANNVLTRLHSVCLTGDVFGSLRCDCGAQLRESMDLISAEGEGIIVYNPTHEGRGTGLLDKLAAYRLQEEGFDTVEANEQIGHAVDSRHYGVDAQILHDLKVASVRLITNNPEKIDQLRVFGIEVNDRIPLWVGQNSHNSFYLKTKEEKLGHFGVGG